MPKTRRRWEGRQFTDEERTTAYRMLLAGAKYTEIATELACSIKLLYRLFGRQNEHLRRSNQRAERHLSLAEREEIRRHLKAGGSMRSIARHLGRAASTITREVQANGGRTAYRAWRADDQAVWRRARPKRPKLSHAALRREVEQHLTDLWSPQQIARHLKRSYPDDMAMHVSHETIYQALFLHGRGELRKELTRHLRTGRMHRRPRSKAGVRQGGPIQGIVMIHDRPAEVEDRAIPGHWEGDLMIGSNTRHAIGTLVERKTRFVMLLHLPNGRTAPAVRDALIERIHELPDHVRRSLTWDQGREMSEHQAIKIHGGSRRVLLQSAQSLVAGQQREYERFTAAILFKRHGLQGRNQRATRCSGGQSQP